MKVRSAWPWPLSLLLLLSSGLIGWTGTVHALDPSKDFHHYVRDAWSIEQGLPQISALAIAQDRQGYLWVGTQAGLARFDGHRFVAYTAESTPELPGGYINDLLYDADGRLWIATYKGLAVRQDGRFASVPLLQDGVPQSMNIVALANSAGNILVAAGDAVHSVEHDVLVPRYRLPGPAYSLMTHGDLLWVGSRGGVFRIGPGNAIEFLPLPEEAANAAVTHLIAAHGRVWAGSSEGLFHRDGDRWLRFADDESLGSTPIEALLEDRDGNLWVAEIAHLARLRDGRLRERIELPEAALGGRVLFEDREGNLWLGSQWHGLTRLRNGWTHRYSVREGLHTPLLWSLAEAGDGRLWVGSDDGLSVFDGARFRQVVAGGELPHPNAYTLLVEGETVWIGTRLGLAIYRDGRLLRPREYAPMNGAQINGILRDRRGDLWFGTTQGLFRQAGQQALERFGEAEGLADPRVRYLLQTSNGRLLIGNNTGLFELVDDRFVQLGLDRGLPAGLDVVVVHELPPGRLVIGTLSEQMFYFDGERWSAIGVEQGMPANAAFFIGHDADYLWIGGIRGVQRVPLVDLIDFAAGQAPRVRGEMLLNERGDRRGGQKGYCCNGAGNAKGVLRSGQLWAPTRDGLVALTAHDVRFPNRPPTTLVERVRVGGRWSDVEQVQHARLPADARDLGFEFTAIHFEDPRSVGFRYRLLGYHEDWREPDEPSQRIVGYTNLPPGDYTFEVQGSSVADRWSEPAVVAFSIQPLFRETAGFQGLLALLAALLGLAGYRWQRRRYKRRAQALERLIDQRTEALAQANLRLQEASHTDPLTGLRNRRYLALQIPKDLAFYDRELRRGTTIGNVIVFAIVDIDHFKRINDVHGHAAGDRVLQQFAEVLQRLVRTGDYVARWGGEEFVLVFRPTPSDQVPLLGERIRASVERHAFDIGSAMPLSVTCSIGLVEYPLFCDAKDSLSWEQLIELADRALYHVKRNGRNGWGAYRPAPGVDVVRVLELLRSDEAEFEGSDDLVLIGSGDRPATATSPA